MGVKEQTRDNVGSEVEGGGVVGAPDGRLRLGRLPRPQSETCVWWGLGREWVEGPGRRVPGVEVVTVRVGRVVVVVDRLTVVGPSTHVPGPTGDP